MYVLSLDKLPSRTEIVVMTTVPQLCCSTLVWQYAAGSAKYLEALVGLRKQWPPDCFALVFWHTKSLMHELKNVLPKQHMLSELGHILGGPLQQQEPHRGSVPHMVFISVLNGVQSTVKIEQ